MTVEDDVETVRAFTSGLRAGDMAGCRALLADDIVFCEAERLPFGGDHVGKDGFMRLMRTVGELFRVKLDTPEIAGCDSFVAVRVIGTMTSRATGRGMPMNVVDCYRLRDGKIARVDVFYHDPQAVIDLCRETTATGSYSTSERGGMP
jgi:ketosteroid isomerase-like protein